MSTFFYSPSNSHNQSPTTARHLPRIAHPCAQYRADTPTPPCILPKSMYVHPMLPTADIIRKLLDHETTLDDLVHEITTTKESLAEWTRLPELEHLFEKLKSLFELRADMLLIQARVHAIACLSRIILRAEDNELTRRAATTILKLNPASAANAPQSGGPTRPPNPQATRKPSGPPIPPTSNIPPHPPSPATTPSSFENRPLKSTTTPLTPATPHDAAYPTTSNLPRPTTTRSTPSKSLNLALPNRPAFDNSITTLAGSPPAASTAAGSTPTRAPPSSRIGQLPSTNSTPSRSAVRSIAETTSLGARPSPTLTITRPAPRRVAN